MLPLVYAALLWLASMRLVLCDPNYLSVRRDMDTNYSNKEGGHSPKYFHEAPFHYHYDGRFATSPVPDSEKVQHLIAMVTTYLSTMADIGVETWIMHGTLLGWWWNQKIMPWDTDLDVQVSETEMYFLAEHYNMTEHTFKLPGIKENRTFLLEVNPNHVNRSPDDWENAIDARWIDTTSGLFIDITSVRKDYRARKLGHQGALMCKDGHTYFEQDIFPLRTSVFEGAPVKVPFDYTKLLIEEYGQECLTQTNYNSHQFNAETKTWEQTNQQ